MTASVSRALFIAIAAGFRAELDVAHKIHDTTARVAVKTAIFRMIARQAAVFKQANSGFDRERFVAAAVGADNLNYADVINASPDLRGNF
jgi:hypothetical protein